MNEQHNQDEIDKYVRDEMSEEEQSAFHTKMEADAELAEEVRFQEQLGETIVFKKLIGDALGQFEERGLHKELPAEKKRLKVFPLRRALALAASIAFLIGAGGIFWANMNYSNRALAGLDYETIEAEASSRSGDEALQSVFDRGAQALQRQAYAQAEDILSGIPENDNNYYLSRLYFGFAQYEQGKYPEAIQNTDILLQNPNVEPGYQDRAGWLKVKALMAGGQSSEAQILLDEIGRAPAHVFHDEALELQRSLRSFWRKLAF